MSIFSKIFNKESETSEGANPALLDQPPDHEAEFSDSELTEAMEAAEGSIDITAPAEEFDEAFEVLAEEELIAEFEATATGEFDELAVTEYAAEEVVSDEDIPEASPLTRDGFLHLSAPSITHLRGLRMVWQTDSLTPWLNECRSTVQMILENAVETEQDELVVALEALAESIRSDNPSRDELSAGYGLLAEIESEAFDFELDQRQRESIIVTTLLRSAGVNQAQMTRLKEAHAASFDVLANHNADELAKEAQLEPSLAAHIIQEFKNHKGGVSAVFASPCLLDDLKRLKKEFVTLHRIHGAFLDVENKWSTEDLARKSELRRARDRAFRSAVVTLARLGELDRIASLNRAPFAQKVEQLETYLRDTASRITGPNSQDKEEEQR